MITDAYTAVTSLLQGNTTLTGLLGYYKGTSIPLIKGGVLAESETDLPCIVFTVDTGIKTEFLGDYSFTVNCYAETEREAYIVANTIIEEFNEVQCPIEGYFTQTTCSILTSVVNPTAKEVNVPVSFRLVNI